MSVTLTAIFLKNEDGYVGFVVELPGFNAHGRTLEEARANLKRLTVIVFDEERSRTESMLEGKDAVRERFAVPATGP